MESAILAIQNPVPLQDIHNSTILRIPCQKKGKREKEMTYVITEESPITEQKQTYAEWMLYESVLAALTKIGALTAEEAEECRIRNQKRMRMKGIL